MMNDFGKLLVLLMIDELEEVVAAKEALLNIGMNGEITAKEGPGEKVILSRKGFEEPLVLNSPKEVEDCITFLEYLEIKLRSRKED